MTQTMKNKDSVKGRPGQRQQERQLRAQRRQRRLQIIISTIVAVLLVIIAISVLIVNARREADLAALKDTQATATAGAQFAQATATNTALNVQATALVEELKKKNPKASETPPAVTKAPTKLPSGLQYIILEEGKGTITAQPGKSITAEYTGWVESSKKKFDSSYDSDRGGNPIVLPSLDEQNVIKGWVEGVKGMKIGETRRLIIPASLAYGAEDKKDQAGKVVIPANSTLIFDVTLVNVQPPVDTSQQQVPQQ